MVPTRDRRPQTGASVPPEPSALEVGLWREILLLEPDTCPWKFACKMAKAGYVSKVDVWQVAEWADGIRENVRRLRLKQIVRDIQDDMRKFG